jgi:hypothetical protein
MTGDVYELSSARQQQRFYCSGSSGMIILFSTEEDLSNYLVCVEGTGSFKEPLVIEQFQPILCESTSKNSGGNICFVNYGGTVTITNNNSEGYIYYRTKKIPDWAKAATTSETQTTAE